jgi:hypothetical protein
MDVSVATFSLNNLFGRWNVYVEVPEMRAIPGAEAPAAVEPPRDWLEEAPRWPRRGGPEHGPPSFPMSRS